MVGCGSAKTPTSADPTPSSTLTGSERLAWSQPAVPAQASSYTYRLYVDGVPVPLEGAACTVSSPGLYDCTAPLPRLSSGRHVLEVAAVSGEGVESPRSPSITVTVGPGS